MAASANIVVPYDPGWPEAFARLAARAQRAVGDLAVAVEHVGSTAVPGLAAKAVIDLDVVVSSPAAVPPALDRLARIGYEPAGRSGVASMVPGLAAPRWPRGEERHHLYVVVDGSDVHRERLAFRDFLRAHPEAARAYADAKLRAQAACGGDWERYSALKHDAVQALLRQALTN